MTTPATGAPLKQLLEVLDLEPVGADTYVGRTPGGPLPRVFGGQLAAQALAAAGRTVADARPVHSLHAYFLRPGDPAVPLEYAVERLSDGRSFSTRRVVARQRGDAVFTLAASFQTPAEGLDHQAPMPDAPCPETLPTTAERIAARGEGYVPPLWLHPLPLDVRHVEVPPYLEPPGAPPRPSQSVWMRADGTLPDDPLLHACVIAYASDLTLLTAVLAAHGVRWRPEMKTASLDHAMWFHRPARVDEWLLYSQVSPTAAGARGFTQARFHTRDGALAVSVAQEGMVRLAADEP